MPNATQNLGVVFLDLHSAATTVTELAATQFTMTNGSLALGALAAPEPFYSKGFAVVTGLAAGVGGIASYFACE